MTHADLHTPPPDSATRAFPPLQAEDYLPILRGLSLTAWGMLAAMIALEVWVRSSADLVWPHMGGFALGYHLVTAVFGIATLMFSLLITHRTWFERAPREASGRLRYLLWVMLVWLALHYFGLLHLTGSIQSPLLLLLPVAIIAAYLSLPAQAAAGTAGGMVAGLVLMKALESSPLLESSGALASTFRTGDQAGLAGAVILLLALLLAVALGRAARAQFHAHNLALHRPPLCDPLTRLYTRDTLIERLRTELVRAHSQNDPTAVLLVEVRNLAGIITDRGFESGALLLRELAGVLSASVRDHMDTPSRYNANGLAALLPTLSEDKARDVIQRLTSAVASSPTASAHTEIQLAIGVAVTHSPATTTPQALLDAAGAALARHAEHPDEPVPIELI